MAKRELNRELHYKNIIAKQKRIIQDLKKKVGRAGKLEDRYYEEHEPLEEVAPPAPQPGGLSCPKCRGELEKIDLGVRTLWRCLDCVYRCSKSTKGAKGV